MCVCIGGGGHRGGERGDSVRVGRNVGDHWAGGRCQWPIEFESILRYSIQMVVYGKGGRWSDDGWMSAVRCLLSTVMNSVLITVACPLARLMTVLKLMS